MYKKFKLFSKFYDNIIKYVFIFKKQIFKKLIDKRFFD